MGWQTPFIYEHGEIIFFITLKNKVMNMEESDFHIESKRLAPAI
jgi:hypothetical protein